MVKLTELGRQEVDTYIRELKEKRNEILRSGLDTGVETLPPGEDFVAYDIEHFERSGEYCVRWGVTDNYDADYPLYLKRGVHYN